MTKLKSTQMPHSGVALGSVLDAKLAIAVSFSTAWDPAAVAPALSISQEFTVTGATVGDFSLHSFSLPLGGLILSSAVNATNKVTVTAFNPTGSSINLGGGTLKLMLLRSA